MWTLTSATHLRDTPLCRPIHSHTQLFLPYSMHAAILLGLSSKGLCLRPLVLCLTVSHSKRGSARDGLHCSVYINSPWGEKVWMNCLRRMGVLPLYLIVYDVERNKMFFRWVHRSFFHKMSQSRNEMEDIFQNKWQGWAHYVRQPWLAVDWAGQHQWDEPQCAQHSFS